MCTHDTLKDVFAGKKKLMKLNKVRFISVPKYNELSVKGLYGKLLTLEGMEPYFPSAYPLGRQCDRDYLFNIAYTLHPKTVQELIDHALKQRYKVEDE